MTTKNWTETASASARAVRAPRDLVSTRRMTAHDDLWTWNANEIWLARAEARAANSDSAPAKGPSASDCASIANYDSPAKPR